MFSVVMETPAGHTDPKGWPRRFAGIELEANFKFVLRLQNIRENIGVADEHTHGHIGLFS